MTADIGATDDLRMDTLADALGVGLELLELFVPDGDCCAIWLGGDDGTTRDFVVCTDEASPDAERLVRYAMVGAALLDDVSQAVLWRTVDDITDGWQLTDDFFDHRADLASIGVSLVDEIALGDDELRSLAVTTFSDPPGWDDVTDRLVDPGGWLDP